MNTKTRQIIQVTYASKTGFEHELRTNSERRVRELITAMTKRGYVNFVVKTVKARKNETAIGEIYESIDY